MEGFDEVFIILDALDECREREDLITDIEGMAAWDTPKLRLLVTSRRERDIEESLSLLLDDENKICIQSYLARDDIRAYVQGRIQTDRKLKRWQKQEVRNEIQDVLVMKAGGMQVFPHPFHP